MPSKGSEQPLIHSLRLLAEKRNKNQELKNYPLDFNFDNCISLHNASLMGNIELINLLLDGGADIAWWIPSIPNGMMLPWIRRSSKVFVGNYVKDPGTALHWAVRAGHRLKQFGFETPDQSIREADGPPSTKQRTTETKLSLQYY